MVRAVRTRLLLSSSVWFIQALAFGRSDSMNGKKARKLRKDAEKETIGLPARASKRLARLFRKADKRRYKIILLD